MEDVCDEEDEDITGETSTDEDDDVKTVLRSLVVDIPP